VCSFLQSSEESDEVSSSLSSDGSSVCLLALARLALSTSLLFTMGDTLDWMVASDTLPPLEELRWLTEPDAGRLRGPLVWRDEGLQW
jgi:hypothetical protein